MSVTGGIFVIAGGERQLTAGYRDKERPCVTKEIPGLLERLYARRRRYPIVYAALPHVPSGEFLWT